LHEVVVVVYIRGPGHHAGAPETASTAPGARKLKQVVTPDPGYIKLVSDYASPSAAAMAFANALVGGIDGLTVTFAAYNGAPYSSALIQLSTDHELYSEFASASGNKGLTVVVTNGDAKFAAIVTGPSAVSSVNSGYGSLFMRLTASKSVSFALSYVFASEDVWANDFFAMWVRKNGGNYVNQVLLPSGEWLFSQVLNNNFQQVRNTRGGAGYAMYDVPCPL
jgi:hypothetical protein